jgi:hypothetical protein
MRLEAMQYITRILEAMDLAEQPQDFIGLLLQGGCDVGHVGLLVLRWWDACKAGLVHCCTAPLEAAPSSGRRPSSAHTPRALLPLHQWPAPLFPHLHRRAHQSPLLPAAPSPPSPLVPHYSNTHPDHTPWLQRPDSRGPCPPAPPGTRSFLLQSSNLDISCRLALINASLSKALVFETSYEEEGSGGLESGGTGGVPRCWRGRWRSPGASGPCLSGSCNR